MKLEDLMGVVRQTSTDDARMAIFSLNDIGFKEATKAALDEEDFNLLTAIQLIANRRTDDGEDAVKLIDTIDEMQF
jgi:hypothetical protein